MTQNTMTPPEHVVAQMIEQAFGPLGPAGLGNSEQLLKAFVMFAGAAAKWGADQELKACCEWIPKWTPWDANQLRAHRRPKSPSLKEQALAICSNSCALTDAPSRQA